MRIFRTPAYWFDSVWLSQRRNLVQAFATKEAALIDFSSCEWIDLQPLVDLSLLITTAHSNANIKLQIGPESEWNAGKRRLVRFLIDSGFLHAISENKQALIEIGPNILAPREFIKEFSSRPFPQPTLDYQTLVPVTIVHCSNFNSRNEVYAFCDRLRSSALRGAKSSKISVPLIYQTKNFFNAVLPELIDNVRVHKSVTHRTLALYARLRRREDESLKRVAVAEPKNTALTRLKRATRHFWQNDIIEVALSDRGESIQETWIAGWRRRNGKDDSAIPRLPDSNAKVDGHLGDRLILAAVFIQGASSLSAAERLKLDLPVKITGLNSVRETIRGSDIYFSVLSGEVNALVFSKFDESSNSGDYTFDVKTAGRTDPIENGGVHYFFRFSATEGRSLNHWHDGLPVEGLAECESWWDADYPQRFQRAYVTSTFRLPDSIKEGDCLICRPHHLVPKASLLEFLHTAANSGIRLIFAELPAAIALTLSQFISLYIQQEEISNCIPIITNNLRIKVPGYSEDAAASFAIADRIEIGDYWWHQKTSPIQSLRDLFCRTRQHDSQIFWERVHTSEESFLRQPVQWGRDVVLNGGYLSFPAALRFSETRKIIRKRLVTLVQALRCKELVPSTDWLRHLTADVERNAAIEGGEGRWILGTVLVTGGTLRKADEFTQDSHLPHFLPVLVYPAELINDHMGNQHHIKRRSFIRALDWTPEAKVAIIRNEHGRQVDVMFRRKGGTDEVRRLDEAMANLESQQGFSSSYETWQRLALLNIGHFSYGAHHYFLWLDLIRFIEGRTSDSHEMIDEMVAQIQAWSPDWIFYPLHEVSETLVQRIVEYAAQQNKNYDWLHRVWPTSSLQDFENCHGRNLRPNSNAVIIDDAMVTGITIRETTAKLLEIGFSQVCSLVLLDRGKRSSCLATSKDLAKRHFSWWTLLVPPVGTQQSCPICRGVEKLQLILSETVSSEISQVLKSWISIWSRSDNLHRFQSRLRDRPLETPVRKSISSEVSILLGTTLSHCSYSLEQVAKQGYPAFLSETEGEIPTEAASEVIAGALLIYWDQLDDSYKNILIRRLFSQLQIEDRKEAMSLLVISLLSFSQTELRKIQKLFNRWISREGLGNIETAVFAYALSHAVAASASEAIEILLSWKREISAAGSAAERTAILKTNGLIDILCAGSPSQLDDIFALLIIGWPGRGESHLHIYDILVELERAGESTHQRWSQIQILKAYLEPIRKAAKRHENLLRQAGILREISSAFREFDSIIATANSSTTAPIKSNSGYLVQVCRTLRTVLSITVSGKPNLRSVLSEYLVHYIPLIISEIIQDLENNGPISGLSKRDFKLRYLFRDEEVIFSRIIREFSHSPTALRTEVQRLDVVGLERPQLDSTLRDCLTDARHPKHAALALESTKRWYMEVAMGISEHYFGRRDGYRVIFRNRATERFAEKASTKSWILTTTILRAIGGHATDRFHNGILERELVFPILKSRKEL